jgi:hypothetical protein
MQKTRVARQTEAPRGQQADAGGEGERGRGLLEPLLQQPPQQQSSGKDLDRDCNAQSNACPIPSRETVRQNDGKRSVPIRKAIERSSNPDFARLNEKNPSGAVRSRADGG